jgi:molybdopterin-biosynthesis enzyme MoeA-like protein
MRKVSLISIGNELLSGQTVNSNGAYLSAELLSAGMPVVSAYVMPDEIDAIARALELILSSPPEDWGRRTMI